MTIFLPDPGNDPNEAYEIVPAEEVPHGPQEPMWTVKANGVVVMHFWTHEAAQRYATDPAYRREAAERWHGQKYHDRKRNPL